MDDDMAGRVPYYYSDLQNYSTGRRDQVATNSNNSLQNNASKASNQDSTYGYRKFLGSNSKMCAAVYANEEGVKSVHSPIYEEIHEMQNKPKTKIYQKWNPFSSKSGSVIPKRKKRIAPPPPERSESADANTTEVLDEVEQVHRQHDHTLQSLNLDMENMIMPDDHSPSNTTMEEYNTLTWEDPNNSPLTSPSATSTASFHWLPAMFAANYSQTQESAFSSSPSSPKAMNEYTFPPPGDQWRSGTLPQPPASQNCEAAKIIPMGKRNEQPLKTTPEEPVYMLYDNFHKKAEEDESAPPSSDQEVIKVLLVYYALSFNLPSLYLAASFTHRRQAPPPPNILATGNTDNGSVFYDHFDRQDNNIYEDLDANVRSNLTKQLSCDVIYKNGHAEAVCVNSARSNSLVSQTSKGYENGYAEKQNYNENCVNSSESGSDSVTQSDDNISQISENTLSRMLDKKKKKKKKSKDKENEQPGGFTRWFSGRRKEFDLTRNKEKLRAKLSQDEETYIDVKIPRKQKHPPPSLPDLPPGLTPQQIKRRYILENIIESENSYVSSLQRLVQNYLKPLKESVPSVISQNKIQTMFHRVEEILQCHSIFGIALCQCVHEWDEKEKIGDVFVASFSQSIVLEIYSEFINNFSIAMETAKQLIKSKSAFADFLKVKQITSPDRLSFFGLMVKPVQRFPQFILLLQDMLKYTPQGHHDRMSLQMALTQLETLAETLNERKRESEQRHAVRDILKHISAKFSVKPISDGNRFLLRQDNVIQMERGQNGVIVKSKDRRLILLNDLLVCVSLSKSKNGNGYDSSNVNRMTLKWAVLLSEVEVLDDPSVTRELLGSSGLNRISSINSKSPEECNSLQTLYRDLSNLMHDFEVISRMTSMITTLRGSYPELNPDFTQAVSQSIQEKIKQKDVEVAFIDSCCLQLSIPVKSKNGKETAVFQTSSPSVKKEWITDLRLSQLSLDPNNMPAWDIPDPDRPLNRIPLFVSAFPVYTAPYFTEVTCGCYYTLPNVTDSEKSKPTQSFLWLCSSDNVNSQISIMSHSQMHGLKQLDSFHLAETMVTAVESVPVSQHKQGSWIITHETVWFGTTSRKIIIMGLNDNLKPEEIAVATVPATITVIKYYFDQVFTALSNGMIAIFRRLNDGNWKLKDPHLIMIGQSPVVYLLPVGSFIYAACGRKVVVVNPYYGEIQKNYNIHHEKVGSVHLMAQSGTGLWLSLKDSSTICLYHTETFRHLQDINIASNVNRVLSEHQFDRTPKLIFVTSLIANKGLLWVGTNVGVVLTIPLPRLEGVPIISGKASVSHHATCSSVTFLHGWSVQALNFPEANDCLLSESPYQELMGNVEKVKCRKQTSDSAIESTSVKQRSSRVLNRRSMLADIGSCKSKTLPSGFSLATAIQLQDSTADVYGLYGDLFNLTPYSHDGTEPFYETLRRSNPELTNMQITTLDRRVRHGSGRPRSLDLSNWSVADTDDSALYDSTPLTTDTTMSSNSSSTLLHVGIKSSSPSGAESNSSTNSIIPEPPVGRCGQPNMNKSNDKYVQRTILTVMGGSGYVNWRRQMDTLKDNMNAHIIVWEMKM
ncbi:Rho guanine nucleotide exchange factor 10 [Nymphon striatum]|nr:Rho guanine nucleotide exchange factor 10 [Nymphon striatum]